MSYKAAIDEDVSAIDGYTVDTRFEHFIDELAHIGRAHNWDNARIIMDDIGNPVMVTLRQACVEKYFNFFVFRGWQGFCIVFIN